MECRQNGLRSHSIDIRRDKRSISDEHKFTPSTSFEWAKTRQRWELSSQQASSITKITICVKSIHLDAMARTNTNMYTQFIRSFDFFFIFLLWFFMTCACFICSQNIIPVLVVVVVMVLLLLLQQSICVCIEIPNSHLDGSVCRYRFGII